MEEQKPKKKTAFIDDEEEEYYDQPRKQQKLQFKSKNVSQDKKSKNVSQDKKSKQASNQEYKQQAFIDDQQYETSTMVQSSNNRNVCANQNNSRSNQQEIIQEIVSGSREDSNNLKLAQEILEVISQQQAYQESEFDKQDTAIQSYYKGDLNGVKIDNEGKITPFYAWRVSFQSLDQIEHNLEDFQELNRLIQLSNNQSILQKYQLNISLKQLNFLKHLLQNYKHDFQNLNDSKKIKVEPPNNNQLNQTIQKEKLISNNEIGQSEIVNDIQIQNKPDFKEIKSQITNVKQNASLYDLINNNIQKQPPNQQIQIASPILLKPEKQIIQDRLLQKNLLSQKLNPINQFDIQRQNVSQISQNVIEQTQLNSRINTNNNNNSDNNNQSTQINSKQNFLEAIQQLLKNCQQ